jgi:hypothetical protein
MDITIASCIKFLLTILAEHLPNSAAMRLLNTAIKFFVR